LRTLGDMPIEWSMKSNLPPKCSIVLSMRFSRSATLVASAGTTIVLHFSASFEMVPMRIDTAVLVRTISAPSSTARSATFQAMDCSFKAPKISPFFPFSKLYAIVIQIKNSGKYNNFFSFGRPPILPAPCKGPAARPGAACDPTQIFIAPEYVVPSGLS